MPLIMKSMQTAEAAPATHTQGCMLYVKKALCKKNMTTPTLALSMARKLAPVCTEQSEADC